MRIEVIHGSILKQTDAEALVSHAPLPLHLLQGPDAALCAAAGPALMRYGQATGLLESGQTVITPGFQLPNLWLIHMRVAAHDTDPEHPLQRALESMLQVAHNHALRSLAMPAWGSVNPLYPPRILARVTAQVLARAEAFAPYLRWVRICLDDAALVPVYASALDEAAVCV
jgi:O-acetyl-ADP-ribose deacetylase